MAKYKNIKSVAHNPAYSFLSDMNVVGTGKALTMVPEALYQTAKARQMRVVTVDFLREAVEPPSISSRSLKESLRGYRTFVARLLAAQNVKCEMVAEAKPTLEFDFAARRTSRYDVGREIPSLGAVASFVDDRGTVHAVPVDKWWCE